MNKLSQIIAAAVVSITTLSPAAASLKDAVRASKSGNWTVLRSIDPMKDSVNCTGIYKENYGIQLTDDALYVSIRGGIQGVTLRFGEKPARTLRLAEDMEKRISSIIISGRDFAELLEGDRLRIQASTLVRGIDNEDLDLDGIKPALESIKAGCPIQNEGAKPMATSAPIKTIRSPAETCPSDLKAKMKAQGLRDVQIAVICK